MSKLNLSVIIHDIRSCYNVGSILRTAEGLGVRDIYFSGYTPYPKIANDPRLPHVASRADKQIKKTALGAESSLNLHLIDNIEKSIIKFKEKGHSVIALEQDEKSVDISKFKPPDNIVLIVGSEREGINSNVLSKCDTILNIPMTGQKESFNVSVAAAIAIYDIANKHKML